MRVSTILIVVMDALGLGGLGRQSGAKILQLPFLEGEGDVVGSLILGQSGMIIWFKGITTLNPKLLTLNPKP